MITDERTRGEILGGLRREVTRGSVVHAAAADELERLWAIVDQLPKCWRLVGGKLVKDVPVTPRMITYCDDAQPLAHQWDMRLGSGETFADHCRRNHERHCDSREAAEATGDE